MRQLLAYTREVSIHPADNSFAVVDGAGVSIVDYRGVVLKRHDREDYNTPATYMGGYIYLLLPYITYPRGPRSVSRASDGGTITGYYLNRPDYVYVNSSTGYRRGYGYDRTTFSGMVTGILKSYSAIVVNTTKGAWLHDKRVNRELLATAYPAGTRVLTLSDYFMAETLGSTLRIYRRDSIDERTLIKTISGAADFADHTMGEVAYHSGGRLYIWTYANNAIRQVRNTAGVSHPLRGLFYIGGELHIVRNNAIYKYIP